MESSKSSLIVLFSILIMISLIGVPDYLLSDQNEPDKDYDFDFRAIYDHYGGIGLFEKGVHIIATSCDPSTIKDKFPTENRYWQKLKESTTISPSNEDFVSLIVSRGDLATGGYSIQVESFTWLGIHPVKLRFHINFTDPGKDFFVTQAMTNPLVLIPLGKFNIGQHIVEIHITQFIVDLDEQGNSIYRPILTFKEEIWTQTFIIHSNHEI